MQTRTQCIFCNAKLKNEILKHDLTCYGGHYAVEHSQTEFQELPFNVYLCEKCGTPQLKYLGNLDEIYKINHADSTGRVMKVLHEIVFQLINSRKSEINNIIEIGGGSGILADHIVKNLKLEYTVIDPDFIGDRWGKRIVTGFYEDVDDSNINANTIIMSHLFEHFYRPTEVLEKIANNKNIDNIVLVFPDFEAYVKKGIRHVLNVEHTYYVSNNFLESVFKRYGFHAQEVIKYDDHSVIFYFQRGPQLTDEIIDANAFDDVYQFLDDINYTVRKFNKVIEEAEGEVFIFPASCHSITLTKFGLNYKKLAGALDNSKRKVNKKIYGVEIPIFPFDHLLDKPNATVLLSGGVFNKEVVGKLEQYGVKCVTA